jgi:hypothetical protein
MKASIPSKTIGIEAFVQPATQETESKEIYDVTMQQVKINLERHKMIKGKEHVVRTPRILEKATQLAPKETKLIQPNTDQRRRASMPNLAYYPTLDTITSRKTHHMLLQHPPALQKKKSGPSSKTLKTCYHFSY